MTCILALIMCVQAPAKEALAPEQTSFLAQHQWAKRVSETTGIWISVDEQLLRVIEGDRVIRQLRCATAAKGTGYIQDSFMTPLGWHSIKRKIGKNAPWGQVFRAKRPTVEIWKPGQDTIEDLVLTRILALTGEEPGINKGDNVDSYARSIYIHGTNEEVKIGTPSSHGCIRLRNDDVITLFDIVPEGTLVLITEKRSTPVP